MASGLPTDALSNLANSVKDMVTGQSGDVDTPRADVKKAKVEAKAVKNADTTVEPRDSDSTTHKEKAEAVVHENVKPQEHEQVNTVVDKEVHQDHYHTTIQPVKDKKSLPTKHVYQENEAEREIDHRDNSAKKAAEQEAAKFGNEKKVEDTTQTKEHAPVKKGENIHHHIHETIQPIIERETIQEKVIHTTDHIHETEHLKGEHHKATVAPAVTMADFEKGAGTQAGGAEVTKEVKKGNKPNTRSTTVDSKKREGSKADADVEAATKIGKLDGTD